ncbi:MAG: hypothetical protein MMC23_007952 [Stictis urceolatum]|nr:hypothetical protein [Stictis urceolata]
MSTLAGTLSVTLLNLACAAGSIITGQLTDHFQLTTIVLLLSFGSAVTVLTLWGWAISAPILYVFSLSYGVLAGGWSAHWTRCSTEVQRDAQKTELGVLIGLFGAGRGIGAVISGPVSERLLQYSFEQSGLSGAYGTKYGILVVFTGVTALLGSLEWALRFHTRQASG